MHCALVISPALRYYVSAKHYIMRHCKLPSLPLWCTGYTRGNLFLTKQPDLESAERTLLLCVLPMKKIWHFSGKIWSTFVVTVLWFSKTEITDKTGILVLVRVLWDVISKNLLKILALFLQKYTWKQSQFLSHWDNVEKLVQFVWNQCQWRRDVCIHYDVSLYQCIQGHEWTSLQPHWPGFAD